MESVRRALGSRQNVTSTMLKYFVMGENDPCVVFCFVFYTIVIGMLSVLGVVGNVLSIAILHKDQHNKVAVFLLQSLAVADNLVLIISYSVLSIIYGLFPYADQSEWSARAIPYIVKYIHPLGYMSQCATVWITVLLAVNRYIAVVKPFLTVKLCTLRNARIQVATVVLLAIAFNIPRFFQYQLVQEHDERNQSVLVLNESVIGEYSYFGVIYTNIIYSVIVLIVPFLMLVTLNMWIIIDLKCRATEMTSPCSSTLSSTSSVNKINHRSRPPSSTRSQPGEDNITASMITIIVVFLCCHTPDRIFQIIRYFVTSYQQLMCGEMLYYVSNACNLLIVINSSTNFIVYYMMRKRFRKILLGKLRAWKNHTTYKDPPSYLDQPALFLQRRHTAPQKTTMYTSSELQENQIHSIQKADSAPNLL